MSNIEHGGFEDCINCGYENLVYTKPELDELSKTVNYNSNGDALCPECNQVNDFCDYFDGH